MATPTIVETYAQISGTLPIPNVQVDDKLILGYGRDYSDPGTPSWTGAGSNTEIGSMVGSPNGPTYANFAMRTWERVATGSGTHELTGTGLMVVYHLRGAGDIDDFSEAQTTQNQSSVTNQVAPSVDTTMSDDLLLGFWGGIHFGSTALTYSIASMTEREEIGPSNGWVRFMSASEVLTSAGATGTRTAVSNTEMTHGTASRLIAIKGVGGTSPPTGPEPGRFLLAV